MIHLSKAALFLALATQGNANKQSLRTPLGLKENLIQ